MSHTNFVVSGLTAYIEQSRDLLIKNIMFGKGSRERMSIQTGVKYKEHLHIFDVDPVFGSGADCGFSAAGTATISERLIEVAPIVVNMELCPKNLVGKYAEYQVKYAATDNPLPFEEYLMDGIVDGINRKIEKMIWLGDKTNQSSDAVLKWIDGFITLAYASASASPSTGVVAEDLTGKNAYEGVMAVYYKLTENVLERGAEIYVSPAIFRAFVQSLVNLNLYHYNPEIPVDEVLIPGTDAKVVKVAGLAGSLKILGTYAKNLVYGTDGENDNEIIDAWWSQDDRTWKIDVEWTSGVQIAFLSECVLGTFAAAPSAASTNFAALNTIATKTGLIATNTAQLSGINTAVTGLNAADKVFKTQEQQG